MKKQTINNVIAAFALSVGATSSLFAGDVDSSIEKNPIETSNKWDSHRADSHAPIGVMGDHTHEQGEWMLSYRYHNMSMDGHRAGTDSLTNQQVFHRGFGVAAEQMDMHMHMWGMMYGVNDWFTFTSMLNYVEKDMQLVRNPHAHGGHGHGHGGSNRFGHSSQGLGDITVGGLIKIYDDNNQRVHLNLGLVLPTAEVDKKQHGAFLPYGMQLGEGVFALKPGVTYLGQSGPLSWGAQATALAHLEDENDSGFSYGDGVNATTWLAYLLSDNVSVSARLNYSYQDEIEGHYNGPHNHVAPPHFQGNYGGHTLEGGLGVNLLLDNGFRVALEGLLPIHQDLNGVGMDREFGFVVGLQKAF